MISLFTDDTIIYIHDKNPRRATIYLQIHVDNKKSWFKKWRLCINAQRTVVVMFSHLKRDTKEIFLDGQLINWSKTTKYLGVLFDKRLIFATHVATTINRATKISGSLYPILNRNNQKRKNIIFEKLAVQI